MRTRPFWGQESDLGGCEGVFKREVGRPSKQTFLHQYVGRVCISVVFAFSFPLPLIIFHVRARSPGSRAVMAADFLSGLVCLLLPSTHAGPFLVSHTLFSFCFQIFAWALNTFSFSPSPGFSFTFLFMHFSLRKSFHKGHYLHPRKSALAPTTSALLLPSVLGYEFSSSCVIVVLMSACPISPEAPSQGLEVSGYPRNTC